VDYCNYCTDVDYDVDYHNVYFCNVVYGLDNQIVHNYFVDCGYDIDSFVAFGNFVDSLFGIVVDIDDFVDFVDRLMVAGSWSIHIVVDIGNHFVIEDKFVVVVENNHTFDFDNIVGCIVDTLGGQHIIEMV
jgi:hypothetical protein